MRKLPFGRSQIKAVATIAALVFAVGPLDAQRGKPEVVTTIDGEEMYQVLPAGAIPAIFDPAFVSGSEAASQMSDREPVMGVVIGGEARAYSLWQLDAHEIVNDRIGDVAFAVTW